MNYQDFLAIIFTPVRYFVNWLSMIANSLMSNYIFLTFLNLTMAISLFYLFYESILFILNKFIYRNLDYLDRKRNYELYKKVQSNYLKTHRNEEFEYLYDSTILRQQVLNGIYRNHPDLLLDNKIHNLKLNVQALKKIKEESLSDDDDSNDDDIDYLVPNIQLAVSKELHKYTGLSLFDLKKIHSDNVDDINSDIERIISQNKELLEKHRLVYRDGVFVNVDSGEVYKMKDFGLKDVYVNTHQFNLKGYNSYGLNREISFSDKAKRDSKGKLRVGITTLTQSEIDNLKSNSNELSSSNFQNEIKNL